MEYLARARLRQRAPGSPNFKSLTNFAHAPRPMDWRVCASDSVWRRREIVALMNRVRQPFNVNPSQMVAAAAALEDDAFIEKNRRVNAEGLAY